jgi:hypothetical protein
MKNPALTTLDQNRLKDATVIDGKTTYYARAEFEKDVTLFALATSCSIPIDMWYNEHFEPVIRFQTELSYSEVLGYMSLVLDGHVMMRTLDVVRNARFYNVVIADEENTRVVPPHDHKKITAKLEGLMENDSWWGDFMKTPESKAIRIMNGGDFRRHNPTLNPEFEDTMPKENIEPMPEWESQYDRPRILPTHKAAFLFGTWRHKKETFLRAFAKIRYQVNVIEDKDLFFHVIRYEGDPADKFPGRIDIRGSEKDIRDVFMLMIEHFPKRIGLDYFIDEDEDDWDEKYSMWLRDRID